MANFKIYTLQLNRKRVVFYTYMFYIIYYKLTLISGGKNKYPNRNMGKEH